MPVDAAVWGAAFTGGAAVAGGAALAGSSAALVVGCGGVSGGGCCPAAESAAGTDGVAGAGEGGCGRVIAAEDAEPLVEGASPAILAERGEFCPSTYPIANATANSRTTMKKPLSS